MSGSYLYCQNTSCGVYLGSLGGDSCSICGWSAGTEDHRISDYDRLEAENKALRAELKQAEDDAEKHELRANQYSAELAALRSRVAVVPDEQEHAEDDGEYAYGWVRGWNECRAACLKSGAVILPERKGGLPPIYEKENLPAFIHQEGWNACLDRLARLNGKTVSEGLLREAERHLGNWLELHACECEGGFHYCGRDQVAKTHRELRGLLDEGKEDGNG